MYKVMIANKQYRGVLNLTRLLKLFLAAFFIGFLLHRFFNLSTGIVFTAIILSLLIAFSQRIQEFYARLESRFFDNLNQREIATAKNNRAELAPWNAHIAPITVEPDATCIGKSLLQLQWRETIGINLVMIKRGDHHLAAPGKEVLIFPNDELLVLGTDHQIQKLRALIRPRSEDQDREITQVELYEYRIPSHSSLVGQTIRATGLRERVQALVVGVERDNERILNPESNFVLAENDIVFIVGNKKKLKTLLKDSELKAIENEA
jgi:CPA2 family monovalent cation:H+ antiporter-2